jgi:hypothetical protein
MPYNPYNSATTAAAAVCDGFQYIDGCLWVCRERVSLSDYIPGILSYQYGDDRGEQTWWVMEGYFEGATT